MSHRPECRRLCRRLSETLHPFSDLASDSVTEEIEKNLLIALSQVFREVKRWTHQLDSNEQELLAEPANDSQCLVATNSNSNDHRCLDNIIGDLMRLLALNSRYSQHLAGNILVAVSEFLLTSDSGWDDFMHLLCVSLEIAICNSLRYLEVRYLDYDSSTSESLLKTKLKSANWSVVAAIFRVLRNIQKYLKQECDDKTMIPYLDSVSSLMNLPWDVLRDIYFGHSTEALKGNDDLRKAEQREITMFFGNLVQFLSSSFEHSIVLEDRVGYSPFICRIINLVTKLTAFCHIKLQSPEHVRISNYFRHKVLMLMVKLCSNINIEKTMPVTFIHLIHKYFEDLLSQPICGVKLDRAGFMEGSPFCTSISDPEKQTMLHSHLQRLAIFLFLKCSLSFASMKKESPDEAQITHNSENCSTSTGFIKLHEWLKVHFLADILANDEPYFERCVRFSLSFLQLFMHEDDILFDMLLQLFHVPFYPDRQIIKNESLAKVENNLVFLASDLFNPVHLFHLFLSEILYDHQVLLDYLISKDTGSSCAEYLLRSLRIICNSWSLFVEFPGSEQGLGQLCPKRTSFMAAKDCLISLRTSINSLNKKNLFPYNPQVLLRRLVRFEELCILTMN
ncbi:hypothetical protein ABFX02_08G044200 [Erythranthe guttata]